VKRLFAGLALMSIAMTGCDESKPTPNAESKPTLNYVLKEVINIEGTCWENHVGQKDKYVGQIVRWENVATSGLVTLPLSRERLLDEVKDPTAYRTPDTVFVPLATDTSQPHRRINGVSSRRENTRGYDSTCELDVKKRGTERSDIGGPLLKLE
jgi:hypothetical protein